MYCWLINMSWSVRGVSLINNFNWLTLIEKHPHYENLSQSKRPALFTKKEAGQSQLFIFWQSPNINTESINSTLGDSFCRAHKRGMKYRSLLAFISSPGIVQTKTSALNYTLNSFWPSWKAPVNSLHAKSARSTDFDAGMFSWLSQEPSTRRVCTAGRITRRPRRAPPPTTTATWATRWRRATSPARGGRDAQSACPRAPTFSERCVPAANEFDATVFIFLSLSACARQNELWTVIRLRFGSSVRRRRDARSSAQKVDGGREKKHIYKISH